MEQVDYQAFVGSLPRCGRNISKTSGKKQNSMGFVLYFSSFQYYDIIHFFHLHVSGVTEEFNGET